MGDVYLASQPGEPSVISATLRFNRAGNWSILADRIDLEGEISGQVTVSWLGSELRGYVLRSRVTDGFCTAVIEGGTGGLTKTANAKMYDLQISAAVVARDILGEVGERLDPTSQLTTALSSWVRRKGTASEQLSALCDAIDCVWRVQLDGSIWIGRDAYSVVRGWDHDVPQDGWHALYGALRVETSQIGALPGRSYQGELPGLTEPRRILSVLYSTGDGPQAWIYFGDDRAPASDNAAEALRHFIRETMRGVEWYPSFSARVAVQRSDGTLDVYPDDRRLPPVTSVRLRLPVPGAKLTVPPGSQVTILFENGDPRQPVAVAYGAGSASAPVALVGDKTQGDALTIACVNGMGQCILTFTGTTRDGVTGSMAITIPGGVVVPDAGPPVVPPAPVTQMNNPQQFFGVSGITGPGSSLLKIP